MIKLEGKKDNAIKLGGIEIEDVREISIEVETPADSRGIFREPTFAATITVVRDASDTAMIELYEMATNVDGRKVLIDGQIDMTGDELAGYKNYSFIIKKAFICNWTLDSPTAPDEPTTETVVLKCGNIEFNDGATSSFKLKNFN